MAPLTLLWAPGARDDLARLREFLREKAPSAAPRAANRILQAAAMIAASPELGRPAGEDLPGFREVVARFGGGAYILRYRVVDEDAVIVLRVWHSREARR